MKRLTMSTIAGVCLALGLGMALPGTAEADHRGHGKKRHHATKHHGRTYYRVDDHRYHARRGPPPHAHARHHRHYAPPPRYWVRDWPPHHHGHGCRHPVHHAYYPRPYYDAGVDIRIDGFYFGWRDY